MHNHTLLNVKLVQCFYKILHSCSDNVKRQGEDKKCFQNGGREPPQLCKMYLNGRLWGMARNLYQDGACKLIPTMKKQIKEKKVSQNKWGQVERQNRRHKILQNRNPCTYFPNNYILKIFLGKFTIRSLPKYTENHAPKRPPEV